MSVHSSITHVRSIAIQKTLLQSNEQIFFPQGMQIELLKHCPHTIPTLVNWVYEEWRSYDASLTKEKLLNSFATRLNDDRIPFTLVVLKNGAPVGTISLKEQGEPEFATLSNGNPWIGSLQVIAEERNKGIGKELLKIAITIAKHLGHQNLFLYTSNPTNREWYCKMGASTIEIRPFRAHTITIMKIPLS